MQSNEIRERYLKFFEKRGHKIISSASLVPENDPTTLFTGSGMQPMLPYLLGQTHPLGTRISDSQKSFRTGDIEEVGDNRHTTFFEMLGNWSFGDYFQNEQIPWIFEFLTKELQIDPKKIFVTVFSGNKENNLAADTKAVDIWKELFKKEGIEAKDITLDSEENGANLGMQDGRIFAYSNKNWWSRAGTPEKMPIGEPGGGDSEMFYEFDFVEHNPKYGKNCHPNCDCGRYIEIGNSVFMEFKKIADKKFEPLPEKNVDFGGGLERISMAVQNTNDIFKIDIFNNLISDLEKISGTKYSDPKYTTSYRVIADHLRASVFLISDGVIPSNTDQGYFVRRLLRRAVRYADILGIKEGNFADLTDSILEYYKYSYPETYNKKEIIKSEIHKEELKFRKTLEAGMKEFEKGIDPFILFTSYGFPFELTKELAKEKGLIVDEAKFKKDLEEHQTLSRAGSEQKFKGGLGGTGEKEVKYHTTTHLLNAALRAVLGNHVSQKGSNITAERLRFDFVHPEKMTDEQKKKVEDYVNGVIALKLPVTCQEMSVDKAKESGAQGVFTDKYDAVVKVYTVGADADHYSKEICGGPHVANTSELGHFKISKEEAVSAGVRRIKAVLE
jgi:alanyl-tRNA synthetase